MTGPRDWYAWHAAYDQPGSDLQQRLGVVQQEVAAALSRAPTGRIRVVSACAGQGRELLPVLGCHPRRPDVSARLIELDARNAAIWTRHRRPPDVTARLRGWLSDAGCAELAFHSPHPEGFTVGVHRFVGRPAAIAPGLRLFSFR